jgi:GR25 family glycosyltransferase involved in LPS biosynthesis
MDAVCINLAKDSDRWDRMILRSKTHGFGIKRFEAVTPDQVTLKFRYDLELTGKACTQSHVELWRDFVNSDSDYIFILEDDVMFRPGFLGELESGLDLIRRADPEWHGLFLNINKPVYPTNEWTKIHDQDCLGAYVLSSQGATTLLSTFNDRFLKCDAMTWWLQKFNHCYGYFPWFSVQEYLDTNLNSQTHFLNDKRMRDDILNSAGLSIKDYI